MNEMIAINYSSETPTVNGRELHAALGVVTDYPHWFARMCEYGFSEGKSYRAILSDRSDGLPGKPKTDHILTVGMAKELCMLQRSDMGRKFREYFISVEEAWNSPEKIMERALQIAHQRAVEAERRVFALAQRNDQLLAENTDLTVALNQSLEYWTVMKYNSEVMGSAWTMAQCQRIGKRLSAYCRANGYVIKPCKTGDDRFAVVNSYPITAWEAFMEERGGECDG